MNIDRKWIMWGVIAVVAYLVWRRYGHSIKSRLTSASTAAAS